MPTKKQPLTLLHFPEQAKQAQELAEALSIPCMEIILHHFPDQESMITLPDMQAGAIIIYLSLDHPNQKLIELMLACETLRDSGNTPIILVAPYLCYMRQDIAFRKGDAVSQKIIGRFLSTLSDCIITVDPHLHRISELTEAIPSKHALAVSSARLQADFLRQQIPDAILAGPDEESEQWVSKLAKYTGLEYFIAHKERYGDRNVKVNLPATDVRGRHIVIVDDIASSGHTMATCAQALAQQGAGNISAMVTHALYDNDTAGLLEQAGIQQVWSTNSVKHPSNRISLTPLLAETLKKLDL